MILSAAEFEQIMATLRSENREGREKRQAPRVGLRMQIRIIVHANGGAVRSELVWLRDLSAGGFGFMHSTPIAPGTLVMVCLPRGNSGSLKLLYRVARCSTVDREQYIIGAHLDRVLEDAAPVPPSNNSGAAPPAAA